VICNRADYNWARDQLRTQDLTARCEVLFSPAWDRQPARELADWILEDRLPVRLQVQLHKYLWGDLPGH
jgi:7-carboxy-7-deazaguanine synthase